MKEKKQKLIQKTVYLEEKLDQEFRIKVILEKTTNTELLNRILKEYLKNSKKK